MINSNHQSDGYEYFFCNQQLSGIIGIFRITLLNVNLILTVREPHGGE